MTTNQSQRNPLNRLFVLATLASCFIYAVFFTSLEQWQGFYTIEDKRADLQDLLQTGEASEVIKDLSAGAYIQLLNDFVWHNPQDVMALQRLATGLIALESYEQALKAIRRLLAVQPNNLDAKRVEIQLLSQLVQPQGVGEPVLSMRQLAHALESFLSVIQNQEDYLLIGSLAQQNGLYGIATQAWERLLARDQRRSESLSPAAAKGRQLIEQMYAQAKQLQLENTDPLGDEAPAQPSPQPEAAQPLLQFTIEGSETLDFNQVADEKGHFQAWISLRHKDQAVGPPIAAQYHRLSLDGSGFEFYLDAGDLVQVEGLESGASYELSVYLSPGHQQQNASLAKKSPFFGRKVFTWSSNMNKLRLKIQKLSQES